MGLWRAALNAPRIRQRTHRHRHQLDLRRELTSDLTTTKPGRPRPSKSNFSRPNFSRHDLNGLHTSVRVSEARPGLRRRQQRRRLHLAGSITDTVNRRYLSRRAIMRCGRSSVSPAARAHLFCKPPESLGPIAAKRSAIIAMVILNDGDQRNSSQSPLISPLMAPAVTRSFWLGHSDPSAKDSECGRRARKQAE